MSIDTPELENGLSTEHLLNSIFCSLFSLLLFAIHCLLRLNVDSELSVGWQFFGFLNLLLFAPWFASWLLSKLTGKLLSALDLEPILLLVTLLLSGMTGYLLGLNIGVFLAGAGFVLLTLGLIVVGKKILTSFSRQIWPLLGSAVLAIYASVWIAGILFSRKYHNALFWEKLHVGATSIDTLFHSAILNMVKNYHAFSCGIDGLVPIKYHMGSHWIFAQWSKLFGSEGLQFYLLGYALIVVPLFFKASLTLATQIQERFLKESEIRYLHRILVFVFGMIGILSYEFALKTGFWFGYIGTESYSVAMTLFLLNTGVALAIYRCWSDKSFEKREKISVCVPLTLLFVLVASCTVFSKLSVAFVSMLLLGYAVLRLSLWKKYYWFVSLLALAGIAYSIFQFSRPPVQSSIVPFNFYIEWIGPVLIWLHVPLFYAWTLAVTAHQLTVNQVKNFGQFKQAVKERKLLLSEFCLVFSVICTLPATLLAFTAGLVHTFMEPQLVLAVIVFAGIFNPSVYSRVQYNKLLPVIYFVCLALATYPVVNSAGLMLQENLRARASILTNSPDIQRMLAPFSEVSESNDLPSKVEALGMIYSDPDFNLTKVVESLPSQRAIGGLSRLAEKSREEKKKTLIYIPQRIESYWNLVKNNLTVPYIAPAISGFAMVDGVPKYGTPLSVYYGLYHHDYGRRPEKQDDSFKNASFLAGLKGFRYVYYVENDSFKCKKLVFQEPKK